MKINISIDLGALLVGVGIGIVLAPFVYDGDIKKVARKGAVKEVTKSIFKRGKENGKDKQ